MSRDAGFDRMDVSTSIADDPKFRALARRHPEQLALALAGYVVGLLATSWREGERLTLEEGWPPLLPWDEATAQALADVGLIDDETRIPVAAWEAWYGAAAERRRLGRERQRRADARRGRGKTDSPSDRQASQGRPSVSTDRPSGRQAGPTLDQRGSNAGLAPDQPLRERTNGLAPSLEQLTCPGCGDLLDDTDTNVTRDRHGQRWHRACPNVATVTA